MLTGRLLRVRINLPLYIPYEGRFVLKHLEVEGPGKLVEELEKLSALGSSWASAALGCLCLLPGRHVRRDPDRALQLCREPAGRGDPYALFVYAWALLHVGQRAAAIRAMKKSALLKFPPAALDLVTFVWRGWGIKERSPQLARDLLRRAFSQHHALAVWWLSNFYRSGQFGALRWVLGWLLAPGAVVWGTLQIRRDPFSSRVFSLSTSSDGPFFKT